jgi:hypothetical protein
LRGLGKGAQNDPASTVGGTSSAAVFEGIDALSRGLGEAHRVAFLAH